MPSKVPNPLGVPVPPNVLARAEAIRQLSQALLKLCGREAACGTMPGGVFCCGFQTWDREEFRRRWSSVMGSEPISQARCERAANICWQLHGTSQGWDGYSNDAVARLVLEVLGKRIAVV
jgi:hypothetical protein